MVVSSPWQPRIYPTHPRTSTFCSKINDTASFGSITIFQDGSQGREAMETTSYTSRCKRLPIRNGRDAGQRWFCDLLEGRHVSTRNTILLKTLRTQSSQVKRPQESHTTLPPRARHPEQTPSSKHSRTAPRFHIRRLHLRLSRTMSQWKSYADGTCKRISHHG